MSQAVIRWISGPVLRAVSKEPFQVHESVLVGKKKLLGEVVRLDGEEITVQVLEETTRLRPGAQVEGREMA